jgi:hypothetical protein
VGGGKKAAVVKQDDRHLTGVGFDVREAAAKYGKERKKK